MLPEIDSVLYMDTDSLFLTSPELVWDFFYQMNSSQIMAMAKVGEIPNVGPYNNKSGLPFYGSTGILATWSNICLGKIYEPIISRIKIQIFFFRYKLWRNLDELDSIASFQLGTIII